MKNNILYISILGMSEPLGKSQVLEYLIDLQKEHNISLYSFEKDLSTKTIDGLSQKMKESGIGWYYQKYSNKYGVVSTIKQILSAYQELKAIVKGKDIEIVHARSLIPVVIALILKRKYNLKVLYDIRGFQIDEKAEVGRLKKGSILYGLLKGIEHYAYKRSDAIVTLTYASVPYIGQFTNKEKITVIPTCANKELFKRMPENEKKVFKEALGYKKSDRVLLHAGAVSNWYDFDSELRIVAWLMKNDKNLHYLILNKSEHDFIAQKIEEFEIDRGRLKVLEVDFYEMYKYLNIADASIFIIKATFSKTASAPTKFAENLACGLYSITNNGIGDMNKFFKKNKTIGYSFDVENIEENLQEVCLEIEKGMEMKKDLEEYDRVYSDSLSKEMAIKKYSQIYHTLVEGR